MSTAIANVRTGAFAALLLSLATAHALAQEARSNDRAQKITITRNGTQPSTKGPAEYFTGSVRVDPLFQRDDPSRTNASNVTFEPGARSAWHTHPLGQKHWHGASPTTGMTHIAVQGAVNGKNVEWMEKVSDQQYGVAPSQTSVPSIDGLGSVSPALERYAANIVAGDLWKRPDLSPRDRSLVTVAALIARNQTARRARFSRGAESPRTSCPRRGGACCR